MEGVELEQPPHEHPFLLEGDEVGDNDGGGDIGASLLEQFQDSRREDHQHLCTVVGAMSQELKDQGFPLTPVAYFGATVSSLERLSQDPSCGADPVVTALLVLLSEVLPMVPPAALRSRAGPVLETVRRILMSGAVSEGTLEGAFLCVPHLMVIGGKDNWSSAAPLYKILLEFMTDSRTEVRKMSHSCIHDVLQAFQGSPNLALASEGIKTVFERLLLLAGGSSSASATSVKEGADGAWNIIYTLNALEYCLPLMAIKHINKILAYCKPLLESQHPIVTRNIVNVLHKLCLSPTSEIPPELFIELLCSLASSASDKENSADVIASTARLLSGGIRKVYELNRQACIVKLPVIFSCLGDILARGHMEAAFTATDTLKGLICYCIDDSLINQGVDQINLTVVGRARRSGPTTIEKICAIIEGLLGYQYNEVWEMSFQILSAMFEKLGQSSSHLMAGAIRNLADMQKLSDDVLVCRKQLHACLGTALGAVGAEEFMYLLPLNLGVEDLSEANVWLLPILKQHIIGARLSFFRKSVLSMIGRLQQKSEKLEREGLIVSARNAKALVYSLWSLLPSFCNYPVDTATGFKSLQKVLCDTLREDPELRGVICSSLQILIQQNRRMLTESIDVLDDEMSNLEQKARDHYTPQLAKENLNAIRSFSAEFFSVLSEILFKDSKDSGGCLQTTIREFASISDKQLVKKFFMHTMYKLLKVIQEINSADQSRSSSSMQIDGSSSESLLSVKRALLLDLAISLLPGLEIEEIDCLFSAIKPGFKDKEGLIQKKTYKILSTILKERDDFLQCKLEELLGMMIDVLPDCHFSAKRYRLDCLYFLIIHISKDASEERKHDMISSHLTEVILALKEANKKTRNRAYDVLVEIGHACGDEERGGKTEHLQQFFNMVAGGLAGETPHMISAAMKGLARLAYEFSELLNAAYNLLPSTFLLLQRENREITKANLGFMKVLVAKTQADGLHVYLKSLIEGLLKWRDDTKSHFKAKVKFLIELLVKKCGLDAVKAVMPEEHMKLFTNIRKIVERKEREGKSKAGSLVSKANSSRLSRWNHTRIFSSFGHVDGEYNSDAGYKDVKTVSGRKTKASLTNSRASSSRLKQRASAKRLSEDLLDQLDLLDRQKTRLSLHLSGNRKRKAESDEEPEIAADGRLVIREEGLRQRGKKRVSSDYDLDTRSEITGRRLRKGTKHLSSDSDAITQAGSESLASSSTRAHRKRQKTKGDSGWAYAGSEYTSKKASGDVKFKDKLEPYAYWPLDRKLLNRRTELKAVARKGMAKVMKRKHEGKGARSIKGSSLSRAQKKAKRKGKLQKKHGRG
uniref:RRP12-like protein n=1 Tax=Anthurium amnicola TaxID=1678845 RepID=A0A1D1YZ83_9ARAE